MIKIGLSPADGPFLRWGNSDGTIYQIVGGRHHCGVSEAVVPEGDRRLLCDADQMRTTEAIGRGASMLHRRNKKLNDFKEMDWLGFRDTFRLFV
jgi:hypothetical protein